MSRRQWTTGLAAAACLGLGALIAALLAGSAWPVLEGLGVWVSVVLALVAVQFVETAAVITDDAQVSRGTLAAYDRPEGDRP